MVNFGLTTTMQGMRPIYLIEIDDLFVTNLFNISIKLIRLHKRKISLANQ